MIVSSLYPRFRDMAIIWSVLSTVLFYASPVLYPIEKVPGTLRDMFLLNPLAPLLELARKWVDRPDRARPGRRWPAAGLQLLPAVAIFVGRLRAGRLGVPARGAADRRGALSAWPRASRSPSSRCWCWPGSG